MKEEKSSLKIIKPLYWLGSVRVGLKWGEFLENLLQKISQSVFIADGCITLNIIIEYQAILIEGNLKYSESEFLHPLLFTFYSIAIKNHFCFKMYENYSIWPLGKCRCY